MEPVHAAKRPELTSAKRPGVTVVTVVEQARRRLRAQRRASFRVRHGARLFLAAATITALRPLVWPLATHQPLSLGPVRSLILLVIGLVTTGLVFVAATRRLPSALATARRLDIALGLDDIIASALSFATQRDNRSSGFRELTIQRATNTLRGLPLETILPRPTSPHPRRTIASSVLLMLVAVLVGSFDPAWVSLLQRPPTPEEQALVAALVRVAEEANEAPNDPETIDEEERAREDAYSSGGSGSETEDALEIARRRANHAADLMARGNREGALRELSAVRSGDREASRRERELDSALRDLARALQRAEHGTSERGSRAGARQGGEQGGEAGRAPRRARRGKTRPASDVRESLRLLTKRLREPARGSDTETAEAEQRRTLERLQRAAQAAGERAARPGATEAERAAAQSLNRAAEALSRGERDAAADAMAEAAQRAAELERQRRAMSRAAEQMARLLERAGLLERAVRLAMLNRESQSERDAGREGDGRSGTAGASSERASSTAASGARSSALASLAARLAGFEQAESVGTASQLAEPHVPDRRNGRGSTASATRSSRDRVDVHEGTRAVQAIEGLGVDGEPTQAYRDVFPTYDAVIEDALENDHVPPARRDVVRRYFESIRPGAERSP